MNRNKRRTHQPHNAQCKTCRHKDADCSAIAFERMPTGSKTTHGITLVDCSCYQPTQQANAKAALRESQLIIAFRVILAGVRKFGTPVVFRIEGAPSETSSRIDQAIRLADTQLPFHFDYQLMSLTGDRMLTIRSLTKAPLSERKCISSCLHALHDQAVTAKELHISEPATELARCTSTLTIKTEDPRYPISEIKALAEALNIQDLYRFGERSLAHVDDISQRDAEQSVVSMLANGKKWLEANQPTGGKVNFDRFVVKIDGSDEGITTSAAMSNQQLESRIESRRAHEASKTAAEPFTAQPEIQALALVMAATIDESGAEHGTIIDGGNFYTRFTRVMYGLTCESPAFTIYLGLPGVSKCTAADITDAMVSVTRKANPQEPLNKRISQLLETFALRVYPNTPIVLSIDKLMALARVRRLFGGQITWFDMPADANPWVEALGLTDVLAMPSATTAEDLKGHALKAISEGLFKPGEDIKLPELYSAHSATLAKLVNDILRQTHTKGYTFHSAAGAFLRIEG